MDYFYDTEFIEDGTTIELISIGIVCSDGREYYAVSNEVDLSRANSWVKENVLIHLPPPEDEQWKSRARIRRDLEAFFGNDKGVRLWAWVGAYDHVVLAQLWGDMPSLPQYIPRFTRELEHLWMLMGRPQLPIAPANAHDALADARHNVVKFDVCAQRYQELTGKKLR